MCKIRRGEPQAREQRSSGYLLHTALYILCGAIDLPGLAHSAWDSFSLLLAETPPLQYLYPDTAAASRQGSCLHAKYCSDSIFCSLQKPPCWPQTGSLMPDRCMLTGACSATLHSYIVTPASTLPFVTAGLVAP